MRIVKRPCHAFTLIELLVVISIISLLVAILLPVLAKARGAAMTIKSTNQIRQLSLAIFLYANDQKDYLPYMRDGNSVDTTTAFWCQQLTVPGYISDPLIFWGPFRDTAWLDTTFIGSTSYMSFLRNSPTSSGCQSPHFYTGYGLNQFLSAPRYTGTVDNGTTHRLGSVVPVYEVYMPTNPSPTNVLLLAEQVFNSPSSSPMDSIVGKVIYKGAYAVGSTKSPIFTPEGKATRSYLDGHAASRNGEDLNWFSQTPITGKWKYSSTIDNTRQAPWFNTK